MFKKTLNAILFPFLLLRDLFVEFSIKNVSEKKRFEIIYKLGYWKPFFGESRSGAGSNLDNTQKISKELPIFLKEFDIKSLLDIPCGDLYWMKNIDLNDVQYVGADIVPAIIYNNKINFSSKTKHFIEMNIIEDELPTVELIFVRDCLVHLETQQVIKALKNVAKSKSIYFASTTFPKVTENKEPIEKDRWRPINLLLPPFSLPSAIKYLDDSSEIIISDTDKKIGIWKINDLKSFR